MKTRADYLAYAVRLSLHIGRLNERLHEALKQALLLAEDEITAAAPDAEDHSDDDAAFALAVVRECQPAARPVPWFAQGARLKRLARELAESAREAANPCRDGSAGAMGAVDRAAVQLEEMAAVVYSVDPERVRSELLAALTTLSVGKRERELARLIQVVLRTAGSAAHGQVLQTADPTDGGVPAPLTYTPEAVCPGCGTTIPQDEKVCAECGIREGDPVQR